MRVSRSLSLVVVAWLATLLAATTAVSIALQAERVASVAEWAASLILCSAIIAVGGGVGRWIVGPRGEASERAALSIGIGLGALSAATFLIGLIGALRPEAGWGLLAIATLLFLRPMRAWLLDLRDAARALSPASSWARWAAAYCLFALALAFAQSLAPATAWDALVYHLKEPELYLVAGRIGLPIDLPYLGFPQFQEMLFLLARLIGAPNVALLHWVFAAATVVLIHALARSLWAEASGWIAAAVYLSSQSIAWLAGWPYVDLALAFHVTAAFACIRRWREGEGVSWLRLGGAFAGLALATKYTAATAVLGLLIVAGLGGRRRGGVWRRLLQYGGMAALVAAPWYVKNWIVTGNPVYPFFFDAPHWDAYRAEWYSRIGTGLAFTAPLRLLTAPIEATILGVEGRGPFGATIGPLFLMLAPVGAIAWRRLAPARDMILVCGVAYAGWLALGALSLLLLQIRLLFPVFPLLAVMGAGGFEALRRSEVLSSSARRLATAIVAASLGFSAFRLAIEFGASGVASVLSGGQSRAAYLIDRLGWHYPAMQAVNELPPGSRVMFLWEPRSLYCRIDCRPDALLDRWWHARRTLDSPQAIAEAWRIEGITHVLIWRAGYRFTLEETIDPISVGDQAALTEFVDTYLTLARDLDGVYQLYRLNP